MPRTSGSSSSPGNECLKGRRWSVEAILLHAIFIIIFISSPTAQHIIVSHSFLLQCKCSRLYLQSSSLLPLVSYYDSTFYWYLRGSSNEDRISIAVMSYSVYYQNEKKMKEKAKKATNSKTILLYYHYLKHYVIDRSSSSGGNYY